MHELAERIAKHPCFGAKGGYGRIHLPVAPDCNIACGYCERRIEKGSCRPGTAEKIMAPEEAMEYIEQNHTAENNLKVAGIAGPGEPLYNENTFETLALLRDRYPHLVRCLSTNGLLLSQALPRLEELEVDSITVTLNTLRPETAEKVYAGTGQVSAEEFLERQQDGIRRAADMGFAVKVNMVYIPGVNSEEVREIAVFAQKSGAAIMNVMPLIPQGRFANTPVPDPGEIEDARVLAGCFIDQLTGCAQCSADAVGLTPCGRLRKRGPVILDR